jgi:hypothetical protein
VPEFEGYVCGAEVDFYVVGDAVVFGAGVPPVTVFQLEECEGEGGEVGFDFADGTTCCEVLGM